MADHAFHPIDVLSASGRLVRIRAVAVVELEAKRAICAARATAGATLHLAAEVEGRIVAALSVIAHDDGHEAHLCIHEEARGDGISRRLIEQATATLGEPRRRSITVCAPAAG